MENNVLKPGIILVDTKTGKRFRVLHTTENVIAAIQLDINKLNIISQYATLIEEMLLSGEMRVFEEEPEVYDLRKLSQEELDKYTQKVEWMRMITDEYGPTYIDLMNKKRKPILDEIGKDSGFSRKHLFSLILRFLQSGCSSTSLINGRLIRKSFGYGVYNSTKKKGRPTEEGNKSGIIINEKALEAFEYAIRLYKENRAASLTHAYDCMLRKYYTYFAFIDGVAMPVLNADGEYPTIRQFYYYCSKHLTRYDKESAKTSKMEARNNSRLLLGDTIRHSYGPGDRIQMDEMESDISLRSSVVEGRTIGRPIVYAMIDAYTRMIIGISVSLDNNSVIGMTNCFLNLLDDKVELCSRYGITITPEMWPSTGLPSRILCDRGAEYTSHETVRIYNELGIQRELVSAGTGSLKGCVERWFHLFQSDVNPMFTKAGLITKRHDSKHHEEASLTLDDYIRIVLQFVVYHNTSILSDYPLDIPMLKEGIKPVPAELWQYGIKKYGAPKPLPNKAQYMYTLMLPVSSYVSRTGINFRGLNYVCSKDTELFKDMIQAGNKHVPIECRIDPRDVGSLYYIRDNHFFRAELNDKKAGNACFAGLTLVEWCSIRKYMNRMKRNGRITKIQYKNYMLSIIELIVKNAKKADASDPSDMKKIREQEKHLIENSNSMFFRLGNELALWTGVPMKDSDNAGYDEKYLFSDIEEEDVYPEEETAHSEGSSAEPYAVPTSEQLKDKKWLYENIFDY